MSRASKLTRREFHVGAGSVVLGGALIVPLGSTAAGHARGAAAPAAEEAGVCDFQRSFMTWDFPYRPDPRPYARHNTPHGNLARIQLDAVLDVVDRQAGSTERFVLIAPCRAEWVYAEDRLFQLPSREFRVIYSLTEQRSMERSTTCTGAPPRGTPVSDSFRSLKIDICPCSRVRQLNTAADIVAATAANLPLIARTYLDDPGGTLQYVLQYPIKTMNFQPLSDSFQVDTGPLLVPDFAATAERAIDRLEMAHIAYNRLDRAEFILRRPTPITGADGKPVCEVLEYSEVCECPARHELLGMES
ncbi:MAG: hypothetical protein GXY58_15945 [Planctomycetaceae bacterium]|nr:hypothetical protein [Planctomycetaceae bacterium]